MILTLSGDVLRRSFFVRFQRPLCARLSCLSWNSGGQLCNCDAESGHELRHCEIITLHLPDLIEMVFRGVPCVRKLFCCCFGCQYCFPLLLLRRLRWCFLVFAFIAIASTTTWYCGIFFRCGRCFFIGAGGGVVSPRRFKCSPPLTAGASSATPFFNSGFVEGRKEFIPFLGLWSNDLFGRRTIGSMALPPIVIMLPR